MDRPLSGRARPGMRRLSTADPGFEADFTALLGEARETTERVDQAVSAIIADVRARGDAALLRLHRTLRPADSDAGSAAYHGGRDRRGSGRHSVPRYGSPRPGGDAHRTFHRKQLPADLRIVDEAGLDAWHALDAARCSRALRAGRQGGLPVVGADERHPRPRRRGRTHRHVRPQPRRHDESAGAGRGAACRRVRNLSRRRRPGDRGARLRHAQRSRPWTASSALATPMSPRPSARCSAVSASMPSPGPPRSSSSRQPATIRASSRWTCSPRPSTTRRRRPS